MKVNNISGSNFYNMPKKAPVAAFRANNNSTFSNTQLQAAQDTVSFTGLMPFQKISPALQKGISELPVSKDLQKQLVKLTGQADTFFAKAKVYMGQFVDDPDLSPTEKNNLNIFSSLSDTIREALSGKNTGNETILNVFYKEKELLKSADKMYAENGIAKTEAQSAIDKKLADIIDEAIQKIEAGDDVSIDYGMDLFKRIMSIFKEIKAADPEGVKEFVEEISAVKLPFWGK